MLRSEILDAARDCVTRDRANTYGPPERNFGLIAAYWSAHLDHPVSATDVSAMMALLKIARVKSSPAHADNWIDIAGFAACGGEIATSGDATDAAIAAVMEPECRQAPRDWGVGPAFAASEPRQPERGCSDCKHRDMGIDEVPCSGCCDDSDAWEPRT